MNEYLAQLYGTNGATEETMDEAMLEKQAAAELLVEVANEQGADLSDIDWDEISTEEIKGILDEVAMASQESEEVDSEETEETEDDQEKVASAEDGGEGDDEAVAALAQADFLGRAMAHAYYAEAQEIEKVAGMKDLASKAAGGAKSAQDWVLGGKARYGAAKAEAKKAFGKAPAGEKVSVKERLMAGGRAAKNVAPELAGAGTLGAMAMRKKEKKEKKGSALDMLIEQRAQEMALEMLAEAGYEVE